MTLLTRMLLFAIIVRRKEKALNAPKSRTKPLRIKEAFDTTQKSLLEELVVEAAKREGVDVDSFRPKVDALVENQQKLISRRKLIPFPSKEAR